MANRNGILRPRRGKRSTAISKEILLKKGEIFFEVPDDGVGTGAGKIVMGDGVTPYEELPYFTDGSGGGTGDVKSVNYVKPDKAGNVDLKEVPYAENLIDHDIINQEDAYIFRTSGGGADIESGDASLDKIEGNCDINPSTGYITVATPTSFKSIGLNQFDKSTSYIANATFTSDGTITSSTGNYVAIIHAVGGLDAGYIAYSPDNCITKIGWSSTAPTQVGDTVIATVDDTNVALITDDSEHSIIKANYDGYICVAVTDMDDLVVHPRWSGGTHDDLTADYSETVIAIPTADVNNTPLPTATYGFPSVNDVRDEIDLTKKTYTQRIGYYPYSEANLETVEELEVDFIYDNSSIFYVLPNPLVCYINIDPKYTVNDFGTEEFTGTTVPVVATTLYGQNLKDKLRRDVLTISEQTLSTSQKDQVLDNIGAAKEPTTISYTDFIALTQEQQESGSWLVTDYPGGGSGGGGGSTNVVALTQAEYDALPSSKLTDGVLYLITDGDTQPYDLDDLDDTDISEPQDGDALVYNATSHKWENSDVISDIQSRLDFLEQISTIASLEV